MRAALPAPSELRGLPLGGRVDAGEVPTLQQLGLSPLPAGCSAAATAGGKGGRAGKGGGGGAAARGSSALDGSTRGGEREALRQLRRFVAQVSGAAGGGGGACGAAHGNNFASSIAPWLATGCLSPRRMLADVQAALGQGGAAPAGAASAAAQPPLTWVRFELLWRDFFRFMTLKYSSLTAGQMGTGASKAAAAPAAAAPALVAA